MDDDYSMQDRSVYQEYNKLVKQTEYKKSCLQYNIEESKELIKIYDRQIEIYEEIRADWAPELDDPQYEGVVSWGYEKEIKELKEKEIPLKEVYDEVIKKLEYKSFLADLNMTHEEWQDWQAKEDEQRKSSFNKKRIKK